MVKKNTKIGYLLEHLTPNNLWNQIFSFKTVLLCCIFIGIIILILLKFLY